MELYAGVDNPECIARPPSCQVTRHVLAGKSVVCAFCKRKTIGHKAIRKPLVPGPIKLVASAFGRPTVRVGTRSRIENRVSRSYTWVSVVTKRQLPVRLLCSTRWMQDRRPAILVIAMIWARRIKALDRSRFHCLLMMAEGRLYNIRGELLSG